MTTSTPSTAIPTAAADPRLSIQVDYKHIVDAQFLLRTFDDELTVVRGDGWITSADRFAYTEARLEKLGGDAFGFTAAA
jgi:hypothetical protein